MLYNLLDRKKISVTQWNPARPMTNLKSALAQAGVRELIVPESRARIWSPTCSIKWLTERLFKWRWDSFGSLPFHIYCNRSPMDAWRAEDYYGSRMPKANVSIPNSVSNMTNDVPCRCHRTDFFLPPFDGQHNGTTTRSAPSPVRSICCGSLRGPCGSVCLFFVFECSRSAQFLFGRSFGWLLYRR